VTASTFRVWDPDECDECDGSDIETDTVRGADESYVESHSDNCDEVNVLVRTENGKLYEVCVEIEHEVTYRAGLPKPYEPEPPTARELHTRTHEDDR
jgi:hypothetical protein